jgi:putative copper resistance protein D
VWRGEPVEGLRRRCWSLVALGALGVAVAQPLSLAVTAAALDVPATTLVARLATTQYAHATLARVLAAILLGGVALAARGSARGQRWAPLALVGVAALVVGTAWTSHGAARLGDRTLLLTLSAVHQLAASVWIGGLLHLLVVVGHSGLSPATAATVGRRFSTMALVAVGALVAGGVGLSLAYADPPGGLVGTSYGLMVLTKGVLLAGLLALGVLNFRTVRAREPVASSLRLRRLVEVELGVGLTVLFTAASLTSLPPAVDVVVDRATPAEVLTRFTPRWPSLSSPPVEAVPVDREAVRTEADRQWSEYNHHVSGLFVLIMGALSLAALAGVRAASHWPLLFLGLGAFILLRSDPEAWPLGPQGFWAAMADVGCGSTGSSSSSWWRWASSSGPRAPAGGGRRGWRARFRSCARSAAPSCSCTGTSPRT